MSKRRRASNRDGRHSAFIGIFAIVIAGFICFTTTIAGATWLVNLIRGEDEQAFTNAPAQWDATSAELTIAVSPLMEPTLREIAERFNDLNLETDDDERASVKLVTMTPDRIVSEAQVRPSFQAISPDSSLWIDQLEQEWASRLQEDADSGDMPISQRRTSGQMRYAVSPVVLIAWEDVARELGWPDNPIGWQDIQRKATEDPDFKWNHAGTNTASGLLATLAEFYAGANTVRGLTEEAATAQETLDYVEAVESTVRFYGEGEDVVVRRLETEGRDFLDAFVGQEQVVIEWNQRYPNDRLVAIYPIEGSLWTDHPLALLEPSAGGEELLVTDNQRQTYRLFSEYLASADVQQLLLASGYRPADLSVPIDGPDSPFADNDAVDWREPQTTLQIPSPAVVDVVRDAWLYTKRPTNVYLVVDTSGSMEGQKIERTREALATFVNQVQGKNDALGIVEFADQLKSFTPLREMDDRSRSDLLRVIQAMEATGGTALIDAVYAATVDLQARGDSEAINALVVMTDGLDNESVHSLRDLQRLLTDERSQEIVIFTIAFGEDADEWLLQDMAESGRGQFRRADEADIEELYRIVSTYF